jgi:hypothetical protein
LINSFPCICGHLYSVHDMTTEFINNENFCLMCDHDYDLQGRVHCWHKYVPDNLKYLEQLNERS